MNGKSKTEGSAGAPDKGNSRESGTSSSAIDSATGEFQAGERHDRFLRTASESGAAIVRVAASDGRRP